MSNKSSRLTSRQLIGGDSMHIARLVHPEKMVQSVAIEKTSPAIRWTTACAASRIFGISWLQSLLHLMSLEPFFDFFETEF